MKVENIHEGLDFQSVTVNKMVNDLSNKYDEIFIEGLRRKGFEFDYKWQLIHFVENNCSSSEYSPRQEKTYYVNKIPFLIHYYKSDIKFEAPTDKEPFKVSATFGTYKYL